MPVSDEQWGSASGATTTHGLDLSQQFAGRVAVITGATQGLGEATARMMADRGAAGIAVVGRDADRGRAVADSLTETTGCRAIFVAADLADAAQTEAVMPAVDAEFGRVDHLVNAAALTVRGSVWDTDVELWDTMLAVNTRAPGLLISGAVKIMKREGLPGTAVNIGSVAAHGGQDFLYAYSASKAALQALTRNAAFTLMRHRIRVNLLQPGWMKTPGEDAIQKRFHDADDTWLETAEAEMSFGRLLDPIEVARAICFFSSDESGMMTGTVVDVDQTVRGAGPSVRPDVNAMNWGET